MQNASPVAYKQNLVFGFCIPASQSDLLKKQTKKNNIFAAQTSDGDDPTGNLSTKQHP